MLGGLAGPQRIAGARPAATADPRRTCCGWGCSAGREGAGGDPPGGQLQPEALQGDTAVARESDHPQQLHVHRRPSVHTSPRSTPPGSFPSGGRRLWTFKYKFGFPGCSAGKESACRAGEPGLILGLPRSPGTGRGYPVQYSWPSVVARLVKKLPAVQETWVRPRGWKMPWRRGRAMHSSILAWRLYGLYSPWVAKGQT